MKAEKIYLKVVKELVKEIDYDIYKGLFVNPEDADDAEGQIENLIGILRENFDIKQPKKK